MSVPAAIAVLLASGRLPTPGEPSTVAFGAVFGGLIGGAVARARRLPHDEISRLTANGVFAGGASAAVIWFVAYCTP